MSIVVFSALTFFTLLALRIILIEGLYFRWGGEKDARPTEANSAQRGKNKNMETKTSKEWEELAHKEIGLVILDPDGWDRTNYEYSFNEEEITKEEFKMRMARSTVQCRRVDLFLEW